MSKERPLLISATTSKRRNLALEQLKVDLKSHPGPNPELDSPDTTLVAANKSEYLLSLIAESMNSAQTAPMASVAIQEIIRAIVERDHVYQVISADVRTETAAPKGNGSDQFINHGKPTSRDELKETFTQMAKSSKKMYRVLAGSQILTYQPRESTPLEFRNQQEFEIVLSPEKLQELASNHGLDEYLEKFDQFYQSETYQNNNLPPISYQDISAGISLPVLIKGNYVDGVYTNDQHLDLSNPARLSKKARKLLKKIIFGVAVGYSPHVLDKIYPGAHKFIIDNWKWLENVVNDVKK